VPHKCATGCDATAEDKIAAGAGEFSNCSFRDRAVIFPAINQDKRATDRLSAVKPDG
jgi:hypothetical protein